MINRQVKRALKGTLHKARRYVQSLDQEDEASRDYGKDDFAYPWLNALFSSMVRDGRAARKPSYAWGVLHGVYLASTLEIKSVSVLEFGVAGGNGLVALEDAAEKTRDIFGVRVDVYGFDTGKGLPPPRDYRDLPNLYREAAFPMDVEKLKRRVKSAQLRLGLVEDTIAGFISARPAPVAFISFDLDYYSSTQHAFKILKADRGLLLPRVHCYFDDIMGFTCSEFNGERLAIAEFNAEHQARKISPIYGLKYYLPPRYAQMEWSEEMYMAHIFDHDLYCRYDGLVRRPFDGGTNLRDFDR